MEHPLLTEGALPWDITLGPDGNMWFTELAGRNIGKITRNGTVTEYPVPGEYGIAGITAGPSDRMWFTENDSSLIGSITLNGVVGQRYPTSPYPFGVTNGPDGNIWFAGGYGNSIGRLSMGRGTSIRACAGGRSPAAVLEHSGASGMFGLGPVDDGMPYELRMGTTPAQTSVRRR